MTAEQFDALAALRGIGKSKAAMAAYRHLVNGDRVVDAAKYAGCSTESAYNCIARIKKAQLLAKVAA
jgi:hypothetical protein